jgi:predicted secreted protein
MKTVQRQVPYFGDQRSMKIIFLAHCLLNENTRYAGGACRRCCVPEIIEQCVATNTGIVQMPCPEQHAWGGVTKRLLRLVYGPHRKLLYSWRGLLVPLLLLYTRQVYRRLAQRIARQLQDYQASGFQVVGVVGIDGSPSCGVTKTVDIGQAFQLAADTGTKTITATRMNEIVRQSLKDGRGLFIEELRRALKRRGVEVPFLAHDLMAELDGKPAQALLAG